MSNPNWFESFTCPFLSQSIKLIAWLVGGSLLVALISSTLNPAVARTSPPLTPVWNDGISDNTYSVAWGDYDGDGDLDLVVGNYHDQNRLYRNDGATLTLAWSSDEQNYTTAVAWGDYDGDGHLDLAIGNDGQPNQVYRNNRGNLELVWTAPYTDSTSSVAWGDWDNDGDLDLAIGNSGSNRVYRNQDQNLIDSGWDDPFSDTTTSLAWGDYDDDGDLDLIAGNASDQPNRLYRNDGGLLVDSGWSDPFNDATWSVAWGDYDGDGDFDLVAGNWEEPNRLYRNDGSTLTDSGWLDPYTDATVEGLWGDMDGDGDLDLVAGNFFAANRLYWNEGGVLVASDWVDDFEHSTYGAALGDYDGDGDLDLIDGCRLASNYLYRNDGGILSDSGWADPFTETTYCGAWGDYDNDGDLDLITGGPGRNLLYRNDAGTLVDSGWTDPYTDTTQSLAWGDYDGDSDLDLAVGNSNGADEFNPTRIFRNDNGTLDPVWSSSENNPGYKVAWGDYDNDGDLDLAVGTYAADDEGSDTYYSPNRVYRNDAGTWVLAWSSDKRRGHTNSVAWGDYDNDGDIDLAVGNDAGRNRVYENSGGTLKLVWSSDDYDFTSSVHWGDVDQDGDIDLIAGNWLMESNRLYRNESGVLTDSGWPDPYGADTVHLAWGDYDSDGDLDLVAANLGRNSLYTNLGGTPIASGWTDSITDDTWFVAWGDYDGDGDLDLVAGNATGTSPTPNRLYCNHLVSSPNLPNQPAYVVVDTPGNTADASFYHSSEVVNSPTITISYRLFDPEGDLVRRIEPYFSPDGGGYWLPATPAGGTITTNLTANSNGVAHTFVWNAQADVVKNDNVIFRLVAHSNPDHTGFMLHPALGGQTFPFRVQAAEWYAKVIDEEGNSVPDVQVYYDGEIITGESGAPLLTDEAGLMNMGQPAPGKPLVALSSSLYEQSTARDGHDGWAYRVYITSLNLDDAGVPHPHVITQPGEQLLTLRRDNSLVLFNVVVSIEWDTTITYTGQISHAFELASDYLYDVTDGQMALGHVSIYDDGAYWADADVQISTRNIVHPHAYVGGITSGDTSHVIRVGRYWNGQTSNQGPWDEPEGYRTLAHEFGHYALYLYDEYFAYTFDANGNLTGETPACCTGPENRNPATDGTNASVMDYQYTSSELSAQGVPGLWSTLCQATAQWQLNGQSPWETVAQAYSDTVSPARWQITTPAARGGVMAGPVGLSSALPGLPQIEVHREGASAPPRRLTVYHPNGGGYWGAIVALYKQDGRVIGQGFTDSNGRLDIYGAVAGDTLRAASFDGGLAGSTTVSTATDLDLALAPVGGLGSRAAGGIPHVQVRAEPGPDPNQIDLLVFLSEFGPGADPVLLVTAPGSETSLAPTLSYSSSTDTYECEISFSATERGMGRIRAVGEVGGGLVRLQSTYQLQRVSNGSSYDVHSTDGNLSLHLAPGSLPGDEAYLVIMPPGAVPGLLPAGLVLIGDPYDVTASGALVTLEKPAVLKLRYDQALVRSASAPEGLGIYRWHPVSETWQAVPGEVDEGQRAMVAPVTTLGTYALLAPPGSWMDQLPNAIFLPVILRNSDSAVND